MKKDETRFTIRFNPVDPRHQRAMEALAAAGRHKASLIADAVCEYLARYGDGSAVTLSPAEQTLESSKPIRMEQHILSQGGNSDTLNLIYTAVTRS